jgi:hypothetical protein
MFLFSRHLRFIILLFSLVTASLFLLLPRPSNPALQPISTPKRKPYKSSTGSQGLSSRIRRAERAYQRMLLGRDALIAKVGPAPRNVALSILSSFSAFS